MDPKFKKLRIQKVVDIDIPKMNEKIEEMTEEQRRTRMKERGILPPRPWMERQFYIACTGGLLLYSWMLITILQEICINL